MVSKKVVASLLLVYVVAMLAEQTKDFVPFFTQSDFWKMQLQEKERNKGGQKKSLTWLQQLEQESFEQPGTDVNKVNPIQRALPVRAGMWLTPRQLEKYQDVLEKLLAEMLQDTPDELLLYIGSRKSNICKVRTDEINDDGPLFRRLMKMVQIYFCPSAYTSPVLMLQEEKQTARHACSSHSMSESLPAGLRQLLG
ncbi:LOW QUALITY PROTEIN: promotilin [Leptosomus discolor]